MRNKRHAIREGDGAKRARGEGGRPGSKALPAENGETALRMWNVAQSALDAGARSNNTGRICARRKTEARRASNAMWQGAR